MRTCRKPHHDLQGAFPRWLNTQRPLSIPLTLRPEPTAQEWWRPASRSLASGIETRRIPRAGPWACGDVLPRPDGVEAVKAKRPERLDLPDHMKKRLREAAGDTGEPVRLVEPVQVRHDLDRRETQRTRQQAAKPRGSHKDSAGDGVLNPRFANVAGRVAAEKKAKQQAAKKRRKSTRRDDLNAPSYKMPEIVITLGGGKKERPIG